MASRRMFSTRIINSARFLKMPVSTQCLYFHLGLHADDDGVVEAYAVMNAVGALEDDLRVLVAKGFVYILNDDLVTYITDWNENNKIRADRKVDSIYKDLLLQILPDVKLVEKRRRADLKLPNGQPMDNQWTTNGQPMDGIGKDSIGEVRLGQGSIGEDNNRIEDDSTPTKKTKHKYGEYGHVLLSDEECEKLKTEYGEVLTDEAVVFLDEYIEMKGAKYKSHYLAIRKWVIDAVKERKAKNKKNNGNELLDMIKDGVFDDDFPL